MLLFNPTRSSSLLLLLLFRVCLIDLVAQCDSTHIINGGSNRLTEPVFVDPEGLVVGLPAGHVTDIDCAGVKHAFIVKRQSTLTLQNVRLFGCSRQAILIRGPAASLVAIRVTFTGHGSVGSTAKGIVIAAQQASLKLTDVTITDNHASLSPLSPAPAFQPPCDNITADKQAKPPACGGPILLSSLIALQQSSLALRSSNLANNTADALIYAAGSAAQAVKLEQGTRVVGNTATWLLVVDSLLHDQGGRNNLLAPHPKLFDPLKPGGTTTFKHAYTADEFIGGVRKLDLPQLANAAQLLNTERFVGVAPGDQAPIQLQVHDASISGNTVQGGLLWLRLVNTSLHRVNITGNAAITAAKATASLAAATSAAALLRRDALQASDERAWPALSPCRTHAQINALIRVHGPAGFDMHRCHVDGNIHPVGGLLRVTDGLGLTSIRSSSLSNNTVAAVLRFEGRTWLTDVARFYAATQFLDVGRFPQLPDTPRGVYRHRQDDVLNMMDTKFRSYQDAALYVRGCRLYGNAVFHGVVLVKGYKQEWQEYEGEYREALRKSQKSQSGTPVLQLYTATWYLVESSLDANRLLVLSNSSGTSRVRQLGIVLSAKPSDILAWAEQRALCQQAVDAGVKSAANKDVRIQPAVFSSFANMGVMSINASGNTGFESVVSQHSTLVTMRAELLHNRVRGNVLRVINSGIWLYDMIASSNTVAGGSVISMEAFEGIAKEVRLVDNVVLPGTNDTATVAASGAAPAAHTAVWRVHKCRALNMSNITIIGTTGPSIGFALDLSEYALEEPLANVVVKNNTASGVRMMTTTPSYDDEGVVVQNVDISDNTVTDEAGGLIMGRFTSGVGTRMSIEVKDSIIANNRRAAGQQLLQLIRGGGVAFKQPAEDPTSNDLTAAFGQLKDLKFRILNTSIQGNSADEGGGVWSAWPVHINSCTISGNTATRAGGGMLLKLPAAYNTMQYPTKGASLVQNTTISYNKAGFGGGLACDGCRLVVNASSITANQADTEVPAAPGVSHCIGINGTNSTNSTNRAAGTNSRVAARNASCTTLTSGSAQLPGATAANPLMSIIPGAGGAIGASLTRDSFVAVCGSGSRADLTSNYAASVGGLVFMSSNDSSCTSTMCPPASWSPCDTALAGGDSSVQGGRGCGVRLKDVDWSNTTAGTKGHLLAWAGPAQARQAFSVLCSSNSSTSSRSSRSSRDSSGNIQSCGCDEHVAAASEHLPAHHHQSAASELLWHLPNILSVYSSACLMGREDRSRAAGRPIPFAWRQCAVSNSSVFTTGPDVALPRVVAGGPVNFTVFLGEHELHMGHGPAPGSRHTSISSLGAVLLQQPADGQLFVIGARSAAFNQQGFAVFTNLTLQPISPPTHNRNYTFSFAADPSSSPLLMSVKPASVRVEVLRCTMGQHMTVNRCVPCATSGTFSLHPNESCQPCVLGGACTSGMLLPAPGYFMHDPFVPQVLPCPLTGACVNFLVLPQQQQRVTIRGRRGLAAAARGLVGDASHGVMRPPLYRNESLLQYVQELAANLIKDPTPRPPLLLDVRYQDILDDWQGLQCAAGYKGLMCGTCDPEYVDIANGATTPTRYALFLNRCVDCSKNPPATLFTLVLLFVLFFLYICMGIAFHVKAENRSFLHLQSSERGADRQQQTSASSAQSRPQHPSTAATAGVVLELVGVTAGAATGRCPSLSMHHASEVPAPPAADGDIRQQALSACTGAPPAQQRCPEQEQAERESCEAAAQGGGPGGGLTSAAQQQQPSSGRCVEASGTAGSAAAAAGRMSQLRQYRSRGLSAGAQLSSQMATLVAVWKVLTSYVQILAMVRYLPFLREMYGGSALTFADLSSFTQFLAFDCILPGPSDKLAVTRILLSAFGVPILLFVAFLVVWLFLWALHRAGAALHAHLSSSGAWDSSSCGSQTCSSLPSFQVLSSGSAATSISTAGQSFSIPTLSSVAEAVAPASQPEACSPFAAAAKRSKSWSVLKPTQSSQDASTASGGPSWELSTAVSAFMKRLPSSTVSSLEKVGASRPPIQLRQYLPLRLLITVGILGYSCYSLFTSNMLQILACHPITGVAGAAPTGKGGQNAGTAAVAALAGVYDATPGLIHRYGAAHYAWLQERYEHTRNKTDLPALCHPGSVAGVQSCQVNGKYWKQDYSVQCYIGEHFWLTILGAVMLAVVGVIIPLLLGMLLWLNKDNLRQSAFAIKYSFFYREYQDHVCFWEFIIMFRKLAFLAIFLAFVPELLIKETATMLQLQLAVMLAVIVLVLHERLRPYKEDLLNTLEKSALIVLTLSFLLLACAVALEANPDQRRALLVLTCVLNFLLLVYFIWHMVKLLWAMFGDRVLRCGQRSRRRRSSSAMWRIQRFVSAGLPRGIARLCSTVGCGHMSSPRRRVRA